MNSEKYYCDISNWNEVKKHFNQLRKSCSALSLVLPDEEWDKISNCEITLDNTHHQSIFLIAYIHGNLNKITEPIHKYVSDSPKSRMEYKKSLIEKWTNIPQKKQTETHSIVRHTSWRAYSGKIYELVFAVFLAKNRIEIIDLEAWNKQTADIVVAVDRQKYLIECKYIGQEVNDFINIFIKKCGFPFTPQAIANYTLFRLCEASLQLKKVDFSDEKRIVVAIVSHENHDYLKMALENNYLNLKNPRFEGYEGMMTKLIQLNPQKEDLYKEIFSNPCNYLSQLDNYVYFWTHQYEFSFVDSFMPIEWLNVSNMNPRLY